MDQEALVKLTKDLKASVSKMTRDEARFLVDSYYQMQNDRLRASAQIRSADQDENGEPHEILDWLKTNSTALENQIKSALGCWAESQPVGKWMMKIGGVGHVIAAGLLAHLDITKAPTVGHFWAFAGLDPSKKWEKKTKRPWNAALKTLVAFKLGECFVRLGDSKGSFYREIFVQRKALEAGRNERLEYKDQAKAALEAKKYGKETDARKAYESGKLPPAHIHARARRYAVKLFLAHLHEVMYRDHYHKEPPLPYPIAMQNHAHKIEVEKAA